MKLTTLAKIGVLASAPIWLVACGGDDDNNGPTTPSPSPSPTPAPDVTVSYQIEISNLTQAQPLAPYAALLHGQNYRGWHIGEPASEGLEMLAEAGAPAEFIGEATSAMSSAAGDGPVMPGNSVSFEISTTMSSSDYAMHNWQLTLASMAGNTNDAFAGVTGLHIASLAMGETMVQLVPIYDAGTEANTETAETVPGPAGGGEGFNEMRDDIMDQVTMHPGVVTSADGYADSTLNQAHRFDQYPMMIKITRM
ncbi:spondin domain-containing protein [Teredinibacter turnerae]|uniref:spondin domain-containing protein n=1 Tax=Teredinibacter turnerae TaxID=2426 RepID=UPI000419211D|nr:spondin domain-containing protein [Teredinibacter turnerae]